MPSFVNCQVCKNAETLAVSAFFLRVVRSYYYVTIEAYESVFSLNCYVKLVIQAHFLLFLAPICPIYLHKSYGTHYVKHMTAFDFVIKKAQPFIVIQSAFKYIHNQKPEPETI